jgi:hypothetical protein
MEIDMKQDSLGGLRTFAWILGAAAIGAAAMYAADPISGNRRRALAKDKLHSTRVKTRKSFHAVSCDLRNRIHGLQARANRLFSAKPSQEKNLSWQ